VGLHVFIKVGDVGVQLGVWQLGEGCGPTRFTWFREAGDLNKLGEKLVDKRVLRIMALRAVGEGDYRGAMVLLKEWRKKLEEEMVEKINSIKREKIIESLEKEKKEKINRWIERLEKRYEKKIEQEIKKRENKIRSRYLGQIKRLEENINRLYMEEYDKVRADLLGLAEPAVEEEQKAEVSEPQRVVAVEPAAQQPRRCAWCDAEIGGDMVKEGILYFHKECYKKFLEGKA